MVAVTVSSSSLSIAVTPTTDGTGFATQPVYLETFGLRATSDANDTTYAVQNTAALATAIAYLKAITQPANAVGRPKNRAYLHVGPGVFVLSTVATNLIDFSGFGLVGSGRDATTLVFKGAGVLLDFGTFSATPSDIFGGVAQGWFISDLSIINPDGYSIPASGSRHGQAIRDNGCGTGRLERVRVGGYAYGWNNPYGADFSVSDSLLCELCDVPAYFGPGCQQGEHRDLIAYLCNEGPVLDRPGHIVFIKPVLNSCKVSNFVIEAFTDTTTRQLSAVPISGISYQSKIVIDTPWFEANAGELGDDTIPDYHIEVRTTSPGDAYRDITIRDPYIVSGTGPTGRVVTAFLARTGAGFGAQRVSVLNPVLRGTITNWVSGLFSSSYIYNRRVTNGFTAPTDVAAGGTMNFYDDLSSTTRKTALPADSHVTDVAVANGVRTRTATGGIVSWAFLNAGSWLQRMGIDIQNKKLFLDDPEAATPTQFTKASAQPASGAWGSGSFVLNTAPTVAAGKVQIGWLRLTSGSANVNGTDWTPVYCTTT